jgi:SWIM zinc finger
VRVAYGPSHDIPGAGPAPFAGPDVSFLERDEPVIMHAPAGRRVSMTAMDRDVAESESSPGTYHELFRKADGAWTCTCPGFRYRLDCKHVQRRLDYDKRC